MKKEQSFISNLFGDNTYATIKRYSIWISLIGSGILIVLYVLSSFFHAGIISSLLNLTSGTSLLFIGYIAAIIVLADRRVEVDDPEYYFHNEVKEPKPFKYKLTIVWGVILLVVGVGAIYFSNWYRNHYSFECEAFLVDEKNGIYHLHWNDDCNIAEEAEELEEMQGYQINKTFRFCEECQEFLEEVESEAD